MTSTVLIGKEHPVTDPRPYKDAYQPVPEPECVLCSWKPNRVVVDAKLCKGHADDLYNQMLADFLAHPDGTCTETCGCTTLEDLRAKYDL